MVKRRLVLAAPFLAAAVGVGRARAQPAVDWDDLEYIFSQGLLDVDVDPVAHMAEDIFPAARGSQATATVERLRSALRAARSADFQGLDLPDLPRWGEIGRLGPRGQDYLGNLKLESFPEWNRIPNRSRPKAGWESDPTKSPETAHLSEMNPQRPFRLTAAVLEAHTAANSYFLRSQTSSPNIVFGIRAARAVGTALPALMVDAIEVDESVPDHETLSCLIGVWHRPSRRLSVFLGSTLPYVRYMYEQRAGRLLCSMLTHGLYEYAVGKHKDVPGCLLTTGSAPYLPRRSYDDLVYRVDEWDNKLPRVLGHNIHPAWTDSTGFSSAGCQVIAGRYDQKGHSGQWEQFRTAAGFAAAQDGTRYQYMLLGVREAAATAMALETDGRVPEFLRYGSDSRALRATRLATGLGTLLSQIEAQLGTTISDQASGQRFAGSVKQRVFQLQRRRGLPATGVLDQRQLAALGLSLPG
jgi:hypothetical protein